MISRRRFAYEARTRALDLLFHPRIVPFRAVAASIASILLRWFRPESSLDYVCRAHCILMLREESRFCSWLRQKLEQSLRRACAPGGAVVRATRPTRWEAVDEKRALSAGLVLKPPRRDGERVLERGVLLLKNNEQLDSFRRVVSMPALLESYVLTLEPSWSGYADPKLLAFASFRDQPIVVMSPCRADHEFVARLETNLRPLSLGASDWVNPEFFRPLPGREKRFDAVMVSRWTLLKRHHLLFRALRHLSDPSYRVALIAHRHCSDRDRDIILGMIDDFGLAHQIEVFEDLDPSGVNEILNQARVNLLLSRQEGSNRSLFEGFFAGVPGLAFADHVGIPKTHFTPQTGRLIATHELTDALRHFRAHWSDYDPRPWALANIAPESSTATLNLALKRLAAERGESWTADIVAKCNRPTLHYYPDDRAGDGMPVMADLICEFRALSWPQPNQSTEA